ncbi:hypothetical protein KEM54_004821 [Ascosphaera aggregata]|nr:hypothetical protein KEM54_004821 [Ascosphaera aggregata]
MVLRSSDISHHKMTVFTASLLNLNLTLSGRHVLLALPLIPLYLLIVQILRYRRCNAQLHKYRHCAERKTMGRMTTQEAWEIVNDTAKLEFPTSSLLALQFALFRTYGIPTISKLLVKTGQLGKSEHALKRYADTSILISEFFVHPPSSARGHEAIARMNYLHSGYRASGKILDDDMLYTLSLFACEPWQWIDRYEWRKLTDIELCAMGTFWKSVGDAMEISYAKLPSFRDEPGHGFRNGYDWLIELKHWSLQYEKEKMVPDNNNKTVADLTVNVLLYPKPNVTCARLVAISIVIRKWAIHNLFLPRPQVLAAKVLDDNPSVDEHHNTCAWQGAPFYVEPTLWRRWSPSAWLSWAVGNPLPGDNKEAYCPEGYAIRDLGPKGFDGRGEEYMGKTKERLARERTGGCPFAILQ